MKLEDLLGTRVIQPRMACRLYLIRPPWWITALDAFLNAMVEILLLTGFFLSQLYVWGL